MCGLTPNLGNRPDRMECRPLALDAGMGMRMPHPLPPAPAGRAPAKHFARGHVSVYRKITYCTNPRSTQEASGQSPGRVGSRQCSIQSSRARSATARASGDRIKTCCLYGPS